MKKYSDGCKDAYLALDLDALHIDGLLWRARCSLALGENDQVIDDAKKLIPISSTKIYGLELRAEALLVMGRYNEAIEDALTLGKHIPGHPRARHILIEAHRKAAFEEEVNS